MNDDVLVLRNHPTYIAFEGIDGAGKTTQIELLCSHLQQLNYTPIRLMEPTWGRHGRKVRELLASSNHRDLDAEERLFTADRREHVEYKILPLLRLVESTQPHGGFKIVQDRTFYSAPTYQGRDDRSMLGAIAKQKEIAPCYDVVLFIDVPVEIAQERLKQRAGEPVQTERVEALERARRRYRVIAEREPTVVIVDGVGEEAAVAERVSQVLPFPRFEPPTSASRTPNLRNPR